MRRPGQKAWEEVADPEISDEGDVIVQVDATASGALKIVLTREEEEEEEARDERSR